VLLHDSGWEIVPLAALLVLHFDGALLRVTACFFGPLAKEEDFEDDFGWMGGMSGV